MHRKATNNTAALPYDPIEDSDISKQTNRFTADTEYDDAGNVTQDNRFRGLSYSYDANGRMFRASDAARSLQSDAVYDGSGLRVVTRVNGAWTFFVHDAFGKMVAEYGGPQQTDEGGVRYVLSDWQGSTRATVSNTGFVQSRSDYTAYGEEIGAAVGQRTTVQGFGGANGLRQKYALTERDEATGLDHTWFRKHENAAGRWTSPDPYNGSSNLASGQSWNRYSYVENDPTNYVDPSGLQM
jgi:RHS repeat-associated protein